MGLAEASRFLGVAPGTLRRWSDAGRVQAFTTPGGHRRFRRATLEGLLPRPSHARPSLVRAGLTPARLARAYRGSVRSVGRQMPWLLALDDEHRDWFRSHGRVLAQHLLAHLDTDDAEASRAALAEARTEATAYGAMASGLDVGLADTVEGFLEFRRPFLHELVLLARRRGFDATVTTDLMEHAERAMDELLIAAMIGHRSDDSGVGA